MAEVTAGEEKGVQWEETWLLVWEVCVCVVMLFVLNFIRGVRCDCTVRPSKTPPRALLLSGRFA